MDFFDDEATGPEATRTSPPPRRRPADRRRTRIQRIVILALILVVVVFAVAWWARSCQHSRKVGSYRDYFQGVATAIKDSDDLGKQFNRFVRNPTKLQRPQLLESLDKWAAGQQEIAVRVARFEAPDALGAQQDQFAQGMKVRAQGFSLLRAAILSSLEKKDGSAEKISALGGYFSGPDAYYMQLVYLQARQAMRDDGVTDVEVPTSTYYLTSTMFDRARIESALSQVVSSAKLTGIHGVALLAVEAVSDGQTIQLTKGATVNVPASADLAFNVKVQNQGDVAENDVPVSVTLVLPDESTLEQPGAIATIAAGQTQSVSITGFAIPTDALTKELVLKVTAGPVEGERVETNNSGRFKFLLQLK